MQKIILYIQPQLRNTTTEQDFVRVDLMEEMSFHGWLSALLTLFTKTNFQIEGSAKLRIVKNVVFLNND